MGIERTSSGYHRAFNYKSSCIGDLVVEVVGALILASISSLCWYREGMGPSDQTRLCSSACGLHVPQESEVMESCIVPLPANEVEPDVEAHRHSQIAHNATNDA